MRDFNLYEIVEVKRGDFSHFGEILSRKTPTDTYMVRMVPGHPGTLREMPADKLVRLLPGPKVKYVHYAIINGNSSFPVDMLRYDHAAPLNFEIIDDGGFTRTKVDKSFGFMSLVVAKASVQPYANWTPARWNSFLWGINEIKTERLNENA